MTYSYDPEIATVLTAMAARPPAAVAARGDWRTVRTNVETQMAALAGMTPPLPDIETRDFTVTAADGESLPARWYALRGSVPGSAVVYSHGGGLVAGTVPLYDSIVSAYVKASGVPFLSIGYRRAPDVHDTVPAEDTFAGVLWLKENAGDLKVDPGRIAVMGDSGGGAPTAGAALLARNNGASLARQILIYPMLDDRNTIPDPHLLPFATWTYDNNFTGWSALLGDSIGSENVSEVAAPGRAENLHDVAAAYLDVGELDIFRDETVAYARKLSAAGVSVELHVHTGAPHAFEMLAPAAAISKRVMADRIRVLRSL